MNRQQAHIARHYQRLFAAAASDVLYSRDTAAVELEAVPAQTVVRVDDGEGASVRSRRRDWIIRAAALVLGGAATLPAVGDRIAPVDEPDNIYEVQRLAGESHYAPCDDLEAHLRVHTIRITEAL
jgi:hypothetical protein